MSRTCVEHLGQRGDECAICLKRERDRLRDVILMEGLYWAEHHDRNGDAEKAKYWRQFANRYRELKKL